MKCVIGILLAAFLIGFNAKHHRVKNDWVGSYVNEYGTVLNIKDETLVDFTFEIINKKGECQESFHGKAVLEKANNASYHDKDNILIITLLRRTDGRIEVSETGFQHAPDCLSFSGIFKPSN
jgi:hypothetical protein